jgi:hypothetical protein
MIIILLICIISIISIVCLSAEDKQEKVITHEIEVVSYYEPDYIDLSGLIHCSQKGTSRFPCKS